MTWFENCVLADIITETARNANRNANPPVQAKERIDALINATFQINWYKVVPVVTLSTEDDNKLLEQLE